MDTRKLMIGVYAVVLTGVIGVGFYFVGSPEHNRKLHEDERKERDINLLKTNITDYYNSNNCKLPADLKALNMEDYYDKPHYPLSSYEYKISDADTYVLCAEFYAPSEGSYLIDNKPRPAGKACIPLEARGYYNDSCKPANSIPSFTSK